MKGTCENSTCSHTDSGVYYTDGHDITTGIITVPDGQVWDYKDYTADYKIPSDYGSWITRPYIIYSVDGVRWKKCKLPEDARNVRFFSGDQLRIGTYAAATSGRYDFIDIKVAFHISYLE